MINAFVVVSTIEFLKSTVIPNSLINTRTFDLANSHQNIQIFEILTGFNHSNLNHSILITQTLPK